MYIEDRIGLRSYLCFWRWGVGVRMIWCMLRLYLGKYFFSSKVIVWGKRRFEGRLGYRGKRIYLGSGDLGLLS